MIPDDTIFQETIKLAGMQMKGEEKQEEVQDLSPEPWKSLNRAQSVGVPALLEPLDTKSKGGKAAVIATSFDDIIYRPIEYFPTKYNFADVGRALRWKKRIKPNNATI